MVVSIPRLAHRIFVMNPDLFVVIADQVIYYLFQCLYDILFRLQFLFGSGSELLQGFLEIDDVEKLYSSENKLFCSLWVDVHGIVSCNSAQTFGD